MKSNKRKPNESHVAPFLEISDGNESSARLPWNYSPPTLKVEGADQFPLIYSTEVNLTIQLKVKEFTRRQATILCGQAIYEVVHEGLSIGDWITLEFLYSYLLGSKNDPMRVKNPKELELLLLLKIILLSGTWMKLEGKVQLPEDVLFLIENSKWIPNERTYYSRFFTFRIDKFLSVRIVPVDLMIERSKETVRYSSYCKGYGESSHMGRRQKTRPSAELDGEEIHIETEEEVILPLELYGLIHYLEPLFEKYRQQSK